MRRCMMLTPRAGIDLVSARAPTRGSGAHWCQINPRACKSGQFHAAHIGFGYLGGALTRQSGISNRNNRVPGIRPRSLSLRIRHPAQKQDAARTVIPDDEHERMIRLERLRRSGSCGIAQSLTGGQGHGQGIIPFSSAILGHSNPVR